MQFWTKLRDHLQTGRPAYLGLVADNTDHSPGTRGAKIFVRPDASTEGTIGGGVMEGDIIRDAVAALENHAPDDAFSATYQTLYHRKKAPGPKSGLACAGTQTNVYALLDPARDLGVVAEIARRRAADQPGLVQIDAAGIRLSDEATISRDIAPVRLITEGAWRYEEQILNWKRAAIFGGGHCGLALSRVLHHLGYTVTIIDTRPDVFTFTENEYARHRITVDDFKDAGTQVAHPELTHAIVMTREQPADVRALSGLVDKPFPYIGVMGSPAKLAQIRKDLAKSGVDPALFDLVRAPIGLPMTSNTPEEIAISIAGELLRERETLFPHAAASV